MRVFIDSGIANSVETISSITTAKGFTSSLLSPTTGNFAGKRAKFAIISVETADIRFTFDGTTPTTTATTAVGHLATTGTYMEIRGEANLANFKCINAVGSSGSVVKATFFF